METQEEKRIKHKAAKNTNDKSRFFIIRLYYKLQISARGYTPITARMSFVMASSFLVASALEEAQQEA